MLVNGVPWPRMEVSTRKYRFRILNGSNARLFQLALNKGGPLTTLGTDGGLLPEPVRLRAIPLSMAERAEVIIDFSRCAPGTKVLLLNTRRDKPELAQLIRFDVTRRERDDSRIPSRLSDPGFLEPPRTANARTWSFRTHLNLREGAPPLVWTINGERFDPERRCHGLPALHFA